MKNAIMYGGGNIGRGFIGALFSQSGYHVTFIDVADKVVDALKTDHRYPVRMVSSEGHIDTEITDVDAINGRDVEAVAKAIADTDIMATAVGVNILKFIVPNIVAGLRKRFAENDRPLNIIICENLMDANKILEGMIKAELTEEECKVFDKSVGLVEASIGRMVPVQTPDMQDGEPLRVCVESYGFLPVDKAVFKGKIPEIKNMVPFEPFDYYLKRKLYIHNMGHATCAYLGDYTGKEYIYQSIDDADTLLIVQNSMLESALALSKKYDLEVVTVIKHIQDLLSRFTNAALKDTCQRVGGDPKRKLSPEDRLIGLSSLCLEEGVMPVFICVGAAGALYRYMKENNLDQTESNAVSVLTEISGLVKESPLLSYILPIYNLFRQGASIAAIRRAAEEMRSVNLKDII